MSFADLGLRPELLTALDALGYEEPTPIQAAAIPVMLEGRDVLGQAATGTGKTAAFALPVLQRVAGGEGPGPRALVLAPTRELAEQVSEATHKYGRALGVRVLPVYGGTSFGRQVKELQRGVDVVVATPGRAVDHLGRGTLSLDAVQVVVLDEADEMLDLGFAEDLETILGAAPEGRQTVLFSATMPDRIEAIAATHQRDPARIELGRAATGAEGAPLVRQVAHVVARAHKAAALGRVLDVEQPTAALVFCRTRDEVDGLAETLNGRGYRAEALHGGLSQEQRDRVMGRLRSQTADLLVATDVAARGIDVEHLTHVVNFDLPAAPEAYVHRIGRVGRAGREGAAITLLEPRQHRLLKAIERATGRPIPVEGVPTVADLRERRLELLRDRVQARLAEGGLDRYRAMLEAVDADVVEVALAALALADTGPADEEEIPDAPAPRERKERRDRGPAQQRPGSGGPVTKVYVGLGRAGKVRPQDLVGAITGETSLRGGDIGRIELFDKFSLVEVPADRASEVVEALRGTSLRGKKPQVRLDRGPGDGPRPGPRRPDRARSG